MTAFNLFNKEEKKGPKKAKAVAPVSDTAESTEATTQVAVSKLVKHAYVSEKASRLAGLNQYTFEVAKNANKPEVKKYIERTYNVHVTKMNMVNMPSKTRTVGRHVGTSPGIRKVIISLKDGESLAEAK